MRGVLTLDEGVVGITDFFLDIPIPLFFIALVGVNVQRGVGAGIAFKKMNQNGYN